MNIKVRVLIIDDEQEAREVLCGLLQKFPEIEIVDKAANVDAGIASFLKHKPDIVFLDIQMPKKDGFAFIDQLQDYIIDTTIIFTTAYNKYAIEAIKHSAFDFLLKPINQLELNKTINRYHETNRRHNLQLDIKHLLEHLTERKKIRFNTRSGFELIKPEDILYLEAERNYTNIYCMSGKTILATLNLKKLEDILEEYDYFFRVSRSVIINTNFLSSFDRKTKKCILFVNSKSHKFKISRERLKDFERVL